MSWKVEDYISHFEATKVPEGFSYNSGQNTEWETIDSLRSLIAQWQEEEKH